MYGPTDVIHDPGNGSVYPRTDYIANYDLTVPFALARSVVFESRMEADRRVGLPQNDPRPVLSAIVLRRNKIPGMEF